MFRHCAKLSVARLTAKVMLAPLVPVSSWLSVTLLSGAGLMATTVVPGGIAVPVAVMPTVMPVTDVRGRVVAPADALPTIGIGESVPGSLASTPCTTGSSVSNAGGVPSVGSCSRGVVADAGTET